MLARPGTYKVGGLGACTLMSRNALAKGASFSEIYNLSFVGEDRHFCIRAVALGLELYADTHYEPYHIYRESELAGVEKYKERLYPYLKGDDQLDKGAMNSIIPSNKITLAMLVKNEAARYLEKVLKHAARYITQAIILDDASDDNTCELCQSILNGIPLTIVSNPEPAFDNEVVLRKQLWRLAANTDPDWILILDGDEIFEDKALEELPILASRKDVDVLYFRLYDMWDELHYREDKYWQAHRQYRPFMVRYKKGFPYKWKETPQHCGRFPINISKLSGAASELRIKHLGWMKQEDRQEKYNRYMTLDPEGRYGILEQYSSILDENPNLLPWLEEEEKHTSDEIKPPPTASTNGGDIIVHTMPLFIKDKHDLSLANSCFSSLAKYYPDSLIVLFNQGKLTNAELTKYLRQFKLRFHILGKGSMVSLALARGTCLNYLWKYLPDIKYISEIAQDMIFPSHWLDEMINFLNTHQDQPMVCPGIINYRGERYPQESDRLILENIPTNDLNGMNEFLSSLSIEKELEGFAYPVVHRAEALKAVGGYNTSFLKGPQGFENDCLLLGYRYYMGLKHNWKPICCLKTYVYQGSTILQTIPGNEGEANLKGLIHMYGLKGIMELEQIHQNNTYYKELYEELFKQLGIEK
ncbi:hypothetical protein N752_21810 [Desulforamulus aquiferis]|nr:glycosyltransferase [Desulforamulus aquiferis]RYD03050.1 hypothetical protein N752_21810 [Desulforamulus aquiferis]